MNSIADAIVYTVAYISCRDTEDEDLTEDDDSAVGHIMAYLSHATPAEEDALASAARRALAEEQSLNTPHQEMVDFFSTWMERMFGRDWDGNDRV